MIRACALCGGALNRTAARRSVLRPRLPPRASPSALSRVHSPSANELRVGVRELVHDLGCSAPQREEQRRERAPQRVRRQALGQRGRLLLRQPLIGLSTAFASTRSRTVARGLRPPCSSGRRARSVAVRARACTRRARREGTGSNSTSRTPAAGFASPTVTVARRGPRRATGSARASPIRSPLRI